jgi:ribosomal protein L44E
MAVTPPTVGKEVDSWCTKCKLILAHTVEAVVGGRITRVHCKTCSGQHAYRAKQPGTGTRARTTRTAAAKTADLPSLLRGRDPNNGRVYATTERYAENEVLRHATFGPGVVTQLKDVNKIEVMFQDGAKVLVHQRR